MQAAGGETGPLGAVVVGDALRERGNLLFAAGEYEQAATLYTEAIGTQAASSTLLTMALGNRAACWLSLAKKQPANTGHALLERCLADCSTALATKPIVSDLKAKLVTRRAKAARRLCTCWLADARQELQSHNWAAAVRYCDRALALTDRPPAAAYSLKGDALTKLADFSTALHSYQSAMLVDPGDTHSELLARRLGRLVADSQTAQVEAKFDHLKLPTDKIISVDIVLAESVLTLELRQVPASIAGLVWNSSIVLAAILEERLLHAGIKPSNMLELGCGLAVTGLAAQRIFSNSACTLSDFDEHVLKTVQDSVDLNGPWSGPEPTVSTLDFRDLASAQALVERSGNFDLLIGADVVYDFSVLELPKLVRHLLGDKKAATALFVSPVGRPRMPEFLAAAADCGLAVTTEILAVDSPIVERQQFEDNDRHFLLISLTLLD